MEEKQIEDILKPVRSGKNCPVKGRCKCIEIAIVQLLALFQKEMEAESEKWNKYWYDYYNKRKLEWQRKNARKHIKKGLCRACFKKAVIGRTRCVRHLQEANEASKLYKLKKQGLEIKTRKYNKAPARQI